MTTFITEVRVQTKQGWVALEGRIIHQSQDIAVVRAGLSVDIPQGYGTEENPVLFITRDATDR